MSKAKILIIDDEEEIVVEMQKLFARNGFPVKVALNGKEALKLVRQEYFDIVYTDMSMPVMDGVAVCKEVKKISPDSVVIVFSGSPHAMAKHQVDFLGHGGVDLYLRKPILSEDLLTTTKDVLRAVERNHLAHG